MTSSTRQKKNRNVILSTTTILLLVIAFSPLLCSSQSWEVIPSNDSPPLPRSAAALTSTNNRNNNNGNALYLFGGSDVTSQITDLWVFETSSMRWSCMPLQGIPIVEARSQTTLWIHAPTQNILLFGGFNATNFQDGFDDTYRYVLDGLYWETLPTHHPDLPHPPQRFSGTPFTLNTTHVGLIGGTNTSHMFVDAWLFEFATITWTPLRPKVVHPLTSSDGLPTNTTGDTCGAELFSQTENIPYVAYYYARYKTTLWLFYPTNASWASRTLTNANTLTSSFSCTGLNTTFIIVGSDNTSSVQRAYVVDTSLTNTSWLTVNNVPNFRGQTLGTSSNRVFLFGGAALQGGFTNALSEVVFNKQQAAIVTIHKSFVNPGPLSDHTINLLFDTLFIVGGVKPDDTLSTNVYCFDTVNAVWTVSGFLPPNKRFGHSSVVVDDVLYIFGGSSTTIPEIAATVRNDIQQFEDQGVNAGWTTVKNEGTTDIPARIFHSADVLTIGSKSYWLTFGGLGASRILRDVWLFDFKAKEWVYKSTLPMSVSPLGSVVVGNGTHLLWFGGVFANNSMNTAIHLLTANSEKQLSWRLLNNVANKGWLTRSYPIIALTMLNPLQFVVTGGLNEREFGINGTLYDVYGTLDANYNVVVRPFKTNVSLMGSAVVTAGDTVYVHGGTIVGPKVKMSSSRITSSLYRILAPARVLDCTPGFYKANPTAASSRCELCPNGTFKGDWGAQACTPCSKTKFQSKRGATTCVKCPEGTYSDQQGLDRCKPCPATSRCGVGSVIPLNVSAEDVVSRLQGSNPLVMNRRPSPLIAEVLFILTNVVTIVVAILLAVMYKWVPCRRYIARCDFLHSDMHNTLDIRYCVSSNSYIGGSLSILVVCFVCGTFFAILSSPIAGTYETRYSALPNFVLTNVDTVIDVTLSATLVDPIKCTCGFMELEGKAKAPAIECSFDASTSLCRGSWHIASSMNVLDTNGIGIEFAVANNISWWIRSNTGFEYKSFTSSWIAAASPQEQITSAYVSLFATPVQYYNSYMDDKEEGWVFSYVTQIVTDNVATASITESMPSLFAFSISVYNALYVEDSVITQPIKTACALLAVFMGAVGTSRIIFLSVTHYQHTDICDIPAFNVMVPEVHEYEVETISPSPSPLRKYPSGRQHRPSIFERMQEQSITGVSLSNFHDALEDSHEEMGILSGKTKRPSSSHPLDKIEISPDVTEQPHVMEGREVDDLVEYVVDHERMEVKPAQEVFFNPNHNNNSISSNYVPKPKPWHSSLYDSLDAPDTETTAHYHNNPHNNSSDLLQLGTLLPPADPRVINFHPHTPTTAIRTPDDAMGRTTVVGVSPIVMNDDNPEFTVRRNPIATSLNQELREDRRDSSVSSLESQREQLRWLEDLGL
eukprot:PhF_6_TR31870/c1_g1_i1/m.47299